MIGNHLDKLLRTSLSKRIFWTGSGEKAILHLKNNIPDLVMMNVNLGGEMTGLDLAKYIRSFWMIPILFFTGYKKERIPEEIWKQSNFYYLPKPFLAFQIRESIKQTLNTQ